ncbi:hypothetical protein V6N11_044931 [Hibiscus sabdariffa]|uniref:Uncharacterized protein n=1 Tax=Hibiscus sabdariffa TaxID=183260 RepID=A0ABR2PUG1_9ROSI
MDREGGRGFDCCIHTKQVEQQRNCISVSYAKFNGRTKFWRKFNAIKDRVGVTRETPDAHGTGDLQQKSQESVAPTVANASIVVPSTFANIEEATSLAMSYDSTGAQHACDTRT